jgi:hypothetical protein
MDKQFLKDIAPYIGPYLIVIGILKLHGFYSYYGINVLEYVALSEVLFLFLHGLLLFLALIVLGILAATLLLRRKKKGDNEGKKETESLNSKKPKAKTAFLIFFSVCAFSAFYQYSTGGSPKFFLASGFMFLCLVYTFVLISRYKTDKRISLLEFSVGISFVAAVFFYLLRFYTALGFEKDHKFFKSTVSLTDSTHIISSDTLSYLGKTQSYLFFYNWKNNSPIILPSSRLNKIEGRSPIREFYF